VVVSPFDKEHIDPIMNGRTREKIEDEREKMIPSFRELREGGDGNHGVAVGGERAT
jgi:hypothetical protein